MSYRIGSNSDQIGLTHRIRSIIYILITCQTSVYSWCSNHINKNIFPADHIPSAVKFNLIYMSATQRLSLKCTICFNSKWKLHMLENFSIFSGTFTIPQISKLKGLEQIWKMCTWDLDGREHAELKYFIRKKFLI
jgi:hypothetical protein